MALKDLVAQKAAFTEAAIEEIIKDYVRYDIDEQEVIFTPAFAELSNKAKILIFLTAHEGWQFVTEEAIAASMTPAALEEHLGIPGGTLRPTLKDLKDRHLITSKNSAYSVRASSFEAIKSELGGISPAPRVKTRKRTRPKKAIDTSPDNEGSIKQESPKRKASKGTNNGTGDRFISWIDEGFFDEARALSDVHERFHQVGIIIPQTSISGYLLKAVRAGKLTRVKKKIGNKSVWVYETA